MAKAESPFRYAAVNTGSLRADCETALAAAARLGAYRDYLAEARAYKASGAGRPGAIDTQVLAEASQALSDIRAVATSMLTVVGSLSRGGALAPLVESWRQGVQAAGTVSTLDLWQHATAGGANRDAITAAGIDDKILAALDDTVSAADLHVGVERDSLRVTGLVNEQAVTASLRTAPRPATASSAADLLTRGRFETLADAVRRGEPAYLGGVGFIAGDLHAEELALHGSLTAVQEGLRHVRKLEDTGLATVEGAGSLAAWVVVLLVISLIGILMAAGSCGHPDALGRENDTCTLGKILAALAFFIILGLASDDYTKKIGSSNLVLGTVLIHGALKDFQALAR